LKEDLFPLKNIFEISSVSLVVVESAQMTLGTYGIEMQVMLHIYL